MFLEILTRTCRPRLLADNQASLARQTDDDWLQTLLPDPEMKGIAASHVALADYAPHLVGDYIWILDDDDLCIWPEMVAGLKKVVNSKKTPLDMIIMRMNHGGRGILPDDDHWGRKPAHGYIGSAAPVIRREVWQAHADAWLSARYSSDFDFIDDIWRRQPRYKIYWLDIVASRVQILGLGRPENDLLQHMEINQGMAL